MKIFCFDTLYIVFVVIFTTLERVLTLQAACAKFSLSGVVALIEESIKQKATKMKSLNKDKKLNRKTVLLCLVAAVICTSFVCIGAAHAAGNVPQNEVAAVVIRDYSEDKPVYDNIVFWSLIFAGSIIGLIALGVNSLKVHRW